MERLTSAQEKALGFIKDHMERIGSAPTLRELCSYMGYKAIGSAQDVISALRKKDFLEKPNRQAARSFVFTDKAKEFFNFQPFGDDSDQVFRVPCLGAVPAGNPLEAIEEESDTLRISTSMLPHPLPKPDELFAVRTFGNSMIEAGILDGDWLVVKVQKEAEPGSVVVARVDGDVTCKRLMNDLKKGWFLKPENPEFSPIYAKDESFEIVGRVIALQRTIS